MQFHFKLIEHVLLIPLNTFEKVHFAGERFITIASEKKPVVGTWKRENWTIIHSIKEFNLSIFIYAFMNICGKCLLVCLIMRLFIIFLHGKFSLSQSLIFYFRWFLCALQVCFLWMRYWWNYCMDKFENFLIKKFQWLLW